MVNEEYRANAEVFIQHFGKKGMRWGRRKAYTNQQMQVRNQRKQVSKKRQYLSDRDLESYISRLSAEKKLKDMTDDSLSPGKAAAKQIMTTSGKQIASGAIAAVALYGIKKLVEKKFGMRI